MMGTQLFGNGNLQPKPTTFEFASKINPSSIYTIEHGRSRDNLPVRAIVADQRVRECSLDELRINDHFALKNNEVPEHLRQMIEGIVEKNKQMAGGQDLPTGQHGGGGLFGNKPQSSFFVPPNQPSALFAGNTQQLAQNQPSPPRTSLFGNPAPQPAQTTGLFANQAAPSTGTGLFANQAAPATGTGLFANKPVESNIPPNQPSALFAGNTNQLPPKNNPSPPKTSLFDHPAAAAAQQTQTTGLFANKPAGSTGTGTGTGLFGGVAPNNNNSTPQKSSGGLFSNSTSNKPQEAAAPQNQPIPFANAPSAGSEAPKTNAAQPTKPASKPAVQAQNIEKPKGFYLDLTKMLFTSSLVELFGEYEASVPEGLLDNTDFMPQLFELFGKYNIEFTKSLVPKVKVSKPADVSGVESEIGDKFKEIKIGTQERSQSQSQEQTRISHDKEEVKYEEYKANEVRPTTHSEEGEKSEKEQKKSDANSSSSEQKNEKAGSLFGSSKTTGTDQDPKK